MPENVNTSTLFIDDESGTNKDNRPTMVSVDHVTMSFNMASEQLNSLKEYAIKLVRGDLFFKEFKALDDVSFEVKKGDVFGIVGTNGSGKSTILKIIAGVLDPSSGTCTVNGNIAPLIELGAGFDIDLSARENIYLNGALLGYSKEFIDQNFDAIVAFAEVETFLDMPMKNYSSGMVARIAFAIATIIVPDILIVDEVLSVGDFMFQKKCEDRINQLIEQHGVTVLIVSHSNDQISRLCNKAVWIEKGHVRLMGDAKQVCQVYGALGGRTGGAEAEREVLETLARSRDLVVPEGFAREMTGETASAICNKLALSAQEQRAHDTKASCGQDSDPHAVVLCCDSTHCNAVVANAFAGAYQAPVFSVGRLSVSDAVEAYLRTHQPAQIFVFDVGRCMSESRTWLESLPWNPEIVTFGNDNDPCLFSLEVFEYGQKQGLWADRASVIGFWDNPEAMALSPYLYAGQCPVLMISDYDLEPEGQERLRAALTNKKILVVGEQTNNHFALLPEGVREAPAEATALAAKQDAASLAALATFVANHQSGKESAFDAGTLYLAPSSHWYDLLTIGYAAADPASQLLLIDDSSLDSILEAFKYVRAHAEEFAQIVLVGDALVRGGLNQRVFYCLWSEQSNQ